jgi:UDP-3-O-[3-hydroxymyristoyl] glucosamine N-acyltransferase
MMKSRTEIPIECPENIRAVEIGEGAAVDKGVTLGYPANRGNSSLLVIGPQSRIRSGTVIYSGSTIGSRLETGHNVIIREQNIIGNNLRIWSNSIIDYGCKLGNNVKIHSNAYISQFTTIEDDVFIGPCVCLANDLHPGCPKAVECMTGPVSKGEPRSGSIPASCQE